MWCSRGSIVTFTGLEIILYRDLTKNELQSLPDYIMYDEDGEESIDLEKLYVPIFETTMSWM